MLGRHALRTGREVGLCRLVIVLTAIFAGLTGVCSVRAASSEEPTPTRTGGDSPPPTTESTDTGDKHGAADAPKVEPPKSADAPKPCDGLPPYTFGYTNGLYATVAGYAGIKDIEVRSQRPIKLIVDGFRKPMPVRAVIQNHVAPLVVVILGLDGKADGKLGRLWPAWLGANGFHVLTFDSTFMAQFTAISGHGVTGNVSVEGERVSQIIAAFLKSGEMRNNVSQIGIVGMSYGGLEALVIGQMARDKKLPFQVDAIQAYSPPIRLAKTGALIDQWYQNDRWNYTLAELANKLSDHKPVPPGATPPFDDSLMRAGIAAMFHLGLADVVIKNDSEYHLGMLPSGSQYDDPYVKQDYAETWGYEKFMGEMSFPYWKRRQNLKELSDMLDPIDLCNLVVRQPAYSETILSVDDPFNTSDDLADLKVCAKDARLTLLPTGGHLGFVGDPWTKAKLLSIFRCTAVNNAPAQAPAPATAPAPTPSPAPAPTTEKQPAPEPAPAPTPELQPAPDASR